MIPGVDLLVVGGLSLDRFPDDRLRAGGTVLHATRAAVAFGASVGSILSAGPEPTAADAVAELAASGPTLVRAAAASTRFIIDERRPLRSLVLEHAGEPLRITRAEVASFGARAVLLAPIGGELPPSAAAATLSVPLRAAALQGWLRLLRAGDPIRPLALERLSVPLARSLGQLDLLVVSLEDLDGEPDPDAALDALRRRFGGHPLLVVTQGTAGAWLDAPRAGRGRVVPPRVVAGVSTVGAGDAFAAILAVELGRGRTPLAAARSAAGHVAELLTGRAR